VDVDRWFIRARPLDRIQHRGDWIVKVHTLAETIATEDVSIATATVELKVVTVNNKQMTLAVFRQLPRSSFMFALNECLTLRDRVRNGDPPRPWGWVNYHWADCTTHGRRIAHRHLVFDHKGALFQCVVFDHNEHEAGEIIAMYEWWNGRRVDDLPQLFIAV
jgi:hypothetical protein